MESLGGVGYCENNHDGGVMNVARIFRDTNVNCIWEGTTSVMAEDLVRALKDNRGDSPIEVVNRQVRRLLRFCRNAFNEECRVVEAAWASFMTSVLSRGAEELLFKGRDLLQQLESILCACLLLCSAHDCGDFASAQVARRWISSTIGHIEAAQELGWREQVVLDREIFLNITQDTYETRSNL